MIGTGLAVLGAGVLGAGATMYGANKAAGVQKDAANQAAAAQREAMDYQKANYDRSRGDLDPFIQNGAGASNTLAEAYGLRGQTALGQSSLEAFRNSPDYAWALKGGSEALDNSAAAKGGVLGGNQIRAQTEYGQGLATQNLQNYFQRLSGMSGQGIQAGGILGQIGSSTGAQVGASANNVGNSLMGAGTAEASGILGGVKGFQSGLSSLSLYSQMGKSSYGGGMGLGLNNTGGLY